MRGLNRGTLPFLFVALFLAFMPYYFFWEYKHVVEPSLVTGSIETSSDTNSGSGYQKTTVEPTDTPIVVTKDVPTELPTEPPTEPPIEPATEPPTEPPVEPPTEPPTDPPTKSPTQLPTEALTKQLTELPVEHAASDKYKLVIGIASMRRGSAQSPRSTLINTLKTVIPRISTEERQSTRVLVFNLQDPPSDHDQISLVKETFKEELSEGFLQIVTNWDGYGDMLNPAVIERTHNDTMGRILWRSKENLDFAFIIDYCSKLAELVLFLEDDVRAANRYISKAMAYFDEPPIQDVGSWLFFSLYTPYPHIRDKIAYPFGCCTQAIIFQSRDLPGLVAYIRERYAKDPVDWLLRDYLEASGKKMYIAVPNIFQHDTTVSTLAEKNFVHTSPSYRED